MCPWTIGAAVALVAVGAAAIALELLRVIVSTLYDVGMLAADQLHIPEASIVHKPLARAVVIVGLGAASIMLGCALLFREILHG
jgi:hypothetical protein